MRPVGVFDVADLFLAPAYLIRCCEDSAIAVVLGARAAVVANAFLAAKCLAVVVA
jgi:hypothetical protein